MMTGVVRDQVISNLKSNGQQMMTVPPSLRRGGEVRYHLLLIFLSVSSIYPLGIGWDLWAAKVTSKLAEVWRAKLFIYEILSPCPIRIADVSLAFG